MTVRDLATVRTWLQEGTARLQAAVDDLDDAGFGAPSGLPGWTRAHVVGHVALNAEALGRLTSWAATGIETPMYADREQRAADIESSARHSVPVLREELRTTAEDLADALARLSAAHWQAPVRSALGREIPATEIPWLRVREVWFHAVDLASGTDVADIPDDLVDALLDDVIVGQSAKPGCPAIHLHVLDRPHDRVLGADPSTRARVAAPATDILAWLSGRGPTPPGAPAELPAWL